MLEKSSNPYTFTSNLRIPVVRVIQAVEKTEAGYEVDDYFYEAAEYNRVYTSPFHRNLVFSMSDKARDLYLMMLYMVNPDYEYIIFSYQKVCELYQECGHKAPRERVFKETVRDMIGMLIIDLKDKAKEQYWINPSIFFQGDRSKKWPENMIVVRTIDNRSVFDKLSTASM